ncbi:hypothetical protein CC1G_08372 [Coprinopsis cinerea okayama7|uniref:Uncharacterized protein n=1 Tax=Coprinopsis cinerea (strain Okayama-7 / 130 / ATCC MYA-4618 / FGSC 9003) TaxID=240176 RepID=A8NAB6_COPC7|nr:hypothetical protein CC1G_08372 [Coprinopsis cinerea okayama7\|eukprot:XP_001831768.2 hypothetical protein CC1G_08372 [Coprinopsis cinerea okayama7\
MVAMFIVMTYLTFHLIPIIAFRDGAFDGAGLIPNKEILGWKIHGPVVDLPPLYEEYFDYEESLPQNIVSATRTKYIHFANHVHLLGFNNHLQELVLNAHLAYLSNRSFVFYEYVWSPAWEEGKLWSVWPEGSGEVEVVGQQDGGTRAKGRIVNGAGGGKIIPSRIPLSVFLGGWVGGGVRVNATGKGEEDDLTPVSRPHFEDICPEQERFYIRANEVSDSPLSRYVNDGRSGSKKVRESTGEEIMKAWVARLGMQDVRDQRCVEIVKDTGQVFDFWVFGTPSIHPLWPSLRLSPALQHWSWSPLVYGVFSRNALGLDFTWPKGPRGIPNAPGGIQLFGPHVKAIVEHEFRTAQQTRLPAITLGYPDYPNHYPYPPFVNSSEELALGAPDVDGLRGAPIITLPYPQTPSAGGQSLQPSSTKSVAPSTLPILALHLRRGDFAEHCSNLAEWNSPFTGFCSLSSANVPFVGGDRRPGVGDQFTVPRVVEGSTPLDGGNSGYEHDRARLARVTISIPDDHEGGDVGTRKVNSKVEFAVSHPPGEWAPTVPPQTEALVHDVPTNEAKKAIYMKRCFPSTEQIGRRVGEVVHDWAAWKFVKFVEAFEMGSRDAGRREDSYQVELSELRRSLEGSVRSVYLMTNGGDAWAGEVGREVGRVLKELEVKIDVEVVVSREQSTGESEKRTRSFKWSNPNWELYVVVGRDDDLDSRDTWEDDELIDGAADDTDPKSSSHAASKLTISSSRNLVLTPEEKHASQAVDMYVAQRAELLIGNGFSSLTSNAVMLRMKDGLDGVQTRFW